jgi:hypothetical protein
MFLASFHNALSIADYVTLSRVENMDFVNDEAWLRPTWKNAIRDQFNPLNAKLNPICHLLALLGAHHILHVSRIRVKVVYLKMSVSTPIKAYRGSTGKAPLIII